MTTTQVESGKLSTFTKFIYGLGDWGTAAATTARSLVWLFFLTEIVDLPIAIAGIVVLIGRIWDAVNDPLTGMLSDRMQSRFGRRRPFFLIGAIPFGLSFFLMFVTPGFTATWQFTVYYIIVFFIYDTSYTLINVPYTALTAELTEDYDERSSLAGWRMATSIFGQLVTAALFKLLADTVFSSWFGEGPNAAGYAVSAAIWGTLMAIIPLLLFRFLEEPDHEPDPDPVDLIGNFRDVFRNRPFRIASVIYLLTFTAVDLVAGVFVFFLQFYIGFAPGVDSIVLGIVLGTAFITMPLNIFLMRRFGKPRTYIFMMSIWAGVMLMLAALPSDASLTVVLVLAAAAGLGVGAANATPWSIVADVVEEDEWLTGKRREGIYAGYLVFFRKLVTGLALAVMSFTLDALGFDATPKSEASIQALRLFIGVIPAILLVLSMVAASRYPLDRQAHEELRRKLAERRALST